MASQTADASGTDFLGNKLPTDFAEVPATSKRTGIGYLQYSNGAIYEGEWLNGERDGLGVCFYPSGNIFVGQFHSGLMEGNGTMFFATGECFSGEFRHSTIYRGVYSSRGREIIGVWQDGHRVSELPAKAPEVLQRARAALFATIVEHVNDYLWETANEPTQLSLPFRQQDSASLRPPLDIPTSAEEDVNAPNADRMSNNSRSIADRSPTLRAQRMATALGFDETNHSLTSLRYRAPSSLGDGESKEWLRNTEVQYGSPDTIFTCAAPSPSEFLSLWRFVRRLFVFLFPFLSLPWISFAPLRITAIQEEREFVVSGAALRNNFDAPTFSLCAIAVGMLCQITSIVIVACRVPLGSVQDGDLTLPDMVMPCVLWFVMGLLGASYYAFFRIPHGLERVDRRLTPRLSAFAASLVDAKASVCIFTYDEDGKGKVMNQHYKYRWLFFAIIFGAAMSLSAPATRGGYGHNMFGRNAFQKAATLLAFFATFFFAATLSFYVLKITDMQREIRAKLHVLSNLAFLERRCIMSPSKHAHMAFDLDELFDPKNLFTGFPGWYCMRSLILCTSACANHGARRTAMGVFWFAMTSAYIVGLADTFYMLANHYDGSDRYYSTGHSYGFFAFIFWGPLLTRYFYVCLVTRRELDRQLYIMDIAGLYQRVKANDADASDIIQQCRRVSELNDAAPEMFARPVYILVCVCTVSLWIAATAAICFQLGEAIYY
ncbi:hypothetical protein ABB37_06604 [Leptomonas pyrrhocoris]|uniref:Uncharacterized protein n=1 Tax=Leptomonas pyrrhocoris TaxID=157538 RepID=A0A0M9FX53_LEPPY|nr:hypothetical protein ABB37_06604 [Leptomonas pyrrhocoris]XP_015656208.1 hypothetical protein ABB37_06604 [Leptomonas pyrrhocoris]KPA77768.1 hypothetical protein ABB37_06604 [Leptomonas pyrrhocoris]KPA77769.1 hypothetical protein ABB37_06604 [Leptomonas pyrrhocoris]|eukprot:XP_015656207.1 hypothetical protein ABB37_06604 [Leptomonas pyrrhocoris]